MMANGALRSPLQPNLQLIVSFCRFVEKSFDHSNHEIDFSSQPLFPPGTSPLYDSVPAIRAIINASNSTDQRLLRYTRRNARVAPCSLGLCCPHKPPGVNKSCTFRIMAHQDSITGKWCASPLEMTVYRADSSKQGRQEAQLDPFSCRRCACSFCDTTCSSYNGAIAFFRHDASLR